MTDRALLAVVLALLLAAQVAVAVALVDGSRRLPATPTPVPTLARPVYPASSRGERPAVLVAGAMGRATATATVSPMAMATLEAVRPPAKFSLGVFTVTAFTDKDDHGMRGDGVMFTGIKTHPGAAAVDPRVIPLWTRLAVEGMGEYTALDTGGAVVGRHVDLWMSDRRNALRFGVQRREVWRLQ